MPAPRSPSPSLARALGFPALAAALEQLQEAPAAIPEVLRGERWASFVLAPASHTLRRSMATVLLNRGVWEEVVSTLLGHESTETTRAAYARLSIQSLAEEVGRALTA